jgi:hypothetical protein
MFVFRGGAILSQIKKFSRASLKNTIKNIDENQDKKRACSNLPF